MSGIEAGQLRQWMAWAHDPGHVFLVLDKRHHGNSPAGTIWNILVNGKVEWESEHTIESDSFEIEDD